MPLLPAMLQADYWGTFTVIDNMPPEEILKHLSPEQRREFEQMLADPSKAASLLNLENDHGVYWWLRDEDISVEDNSKDSSGTQAIVPLPRAKLPKSSATASSLQCNLIAIL